VSKPWKPGRQTVALGKSRIRRDPVPVAKPTVIRVASPEAEMWGGVTGIVLFAIGIAVLIIGVGVATFSKYASIDEARALQFNQCYNGGQNCVFDGATIRVDGTKIAIAGIQAPQIIGAKCSAERSLGIDAAVGLAELLNSGKVSTGKPFRDYYGRDVSKVLIDGRDVGEIMVNRNAARKYDGTTYDWCD
jgi:endonuclease YncB( thermonuclease family)